MDNNMPKILLIIDDDEDIRRSFPIALRRDQWECKCFPSWQEASSKVPSEIKPDAAIIDLHLPYDLPLNGIEVIKKLAQLLPELSIVALTGQEEYTAAAKQCIENGAVQFLRKPVEPPELYERLHQAVWIKDMAAKIEKSKIEQQIAARVQELFLSHNELAVDRLDIQDYNQPATIVLGDYYDFHASPQTQQLFLAIGDAKSHGIPAALNAHMVGGILRGILEMDGKQLTPAQAMGIINRVVARSGSQEGDMTLLLACIDIQTLLFSYARAGHPYPVILRNGDHIFLKNEGGRQLGVQEDCVYTNWDYQLEEGDFILLFSDGLYEVACQTNNGKKQLGIEGLAKEAIMLLKQGTYDFPRRLANRVLELADDTKFDDDCTVVMIEVIRSA